MILFLDFDGVLHHENVVNENGRPHLPVAGHTLLQWVDPLIEVLGEAPDVQIVLSTSWVPTLGFEETKAHLPAVIQERVVGATCCAESLQEIIRTNPYHRWENLPRWKQIRAYARANPSLLDWIAIDDDVRGWPDYWDQYLVQTDGALGLSDPAVVDDLRGKLLASVAL